jgi:hypothetical protein
MADVPAGQTFPEWLKDKGPGGSDSRADRMSQLEGSGKFKQRTDTEWELKGQTYTLPSGMDGQRENVFAYCLYLSHGGTGEYVAHK